jgi:hypothetical protein
MRALKLLGVVAALWLTVPATAYAGDCGSCGRSAYGDYCQGRRWGWYGAKDPVKTAKDARERLETFFEDEDVVVGEITEKQTYYQADVTTAGGDLVDQVIIDKRTGRIRSIH